MRIGLREGLVDGADAIGDALSLREKLFGLTDRLLELGQGRVGQILKVLRLVHQHPGLVLKALDLIVDLLQRPRCGQDILRVVGRIEDDPLRMGVTDCG